MQDLHTSFCYFLVTIASAKQNQHRANDSKHNWKAVTTESMKMIHKKFAKCKHLIIGPDTQLHIFLMLLNAT